MFSLATTQSLLRTSAKSLLKPSGYALQATQFSTEGYVEKQRKLGRPVSPHVTIYAFPLAAISSVTHRVTGGMLTIGLYGTGVLGLVGADIGALYSSMGSSGLGPLVKFSVAWPLIYHFGCGIRHLYWEKFPEGLNPVTQYQSSAAILGVSSVLGLAACFI